MKSLSLRAKIYILATILAGAFLAIWEIYPFQVQNIWLILVLSIAGSLSLIFKVEGATVRSHYNFSFFVYAFTLIAIGVQAAILVVLFSNFVEWVYHRYPWYIQSFNIGSYVVIIYLGGLLASWTNPSGTLTGPGGIAGVLLIIISFTLLNHL